MIPFPFTLLTNGNKHRRRNSLAPFQRMPHALGATVGRIGFAHRPASPRGNVSGWLGRKAESAAQDKYPRRRFQHRGRAGITRDPRGPIRNTSSPVTS